jgi:hypothetical protein
LPAHLDHAMQWSMEWFVDLKDIILPLVEYSPRIQGTRVSKV